MNKRVRDTIALAIVALTLVILVHPQVLGARGVIGLASQRTIEKTAPAATAAQPSYTEGVMWESDAAEVSDAY